MVNGLNTAHIGYESMTDAAWVDEVRIPVELTTCAGHG